MPLKLHRISHFLENRFKYGQENYFRKTQGKL